MPVAIKAVVRPNRRMVRVVNDIKAYATLNRILKMPELSALESAIVTQEYCQPDKLYLILITIFTIQPQSIRVLRFMHRHDN